MKVIEDGMIVSYLTLRKIIGILGLLWPFVLALGALLFFQTGLQHSISAYYYSPMTVVFVGTLWAVGFFLFSYNGYDNDRILKDGYLSRVAWVCALGAAFFPTHQNDGDTDLAGYLHFVFVASFFLILIYFSLVQFTRTSGHPTKKKFHRNMVYRACGYAMIASIALIVIYYRLPTEVADRIEPYRPVFWLESIAIVSFGFSWLTKGEAILKDESTPEPIARAHSG